MKQKLKKQFNILKGLVPFDQIPDLSKDINLGRNDFWLIGVGKGALSMCDDLNIDDSHIIDGIIITGTKEIKEKPYQVFEGSHPYPTKDTVAASYELLDLIRRVPDGDHVVFCLSGGASAMLCIPPFGVEIKDLQELYRLLLNSGASIHEMNVVRKHTCELKGGKLAQELKHTRLTTLISSDVPGDDPGTIGSGPTIHDSSTFKDAYDILINYKLWNEIPTGIKDHIQFGVDGIVPENPKPGNDEHPDHTVKVISKSSGLAEQVALRLKKEGYNTWVSSDSYSGNVQKVSKQICSKAVAVLGGKDEVKKPAALVFHGESTVNVKGNGKGGRNQELALMAALSIEGQHPISIFSMGTDGIDGPTDAAGAIVNSETTLIARKKKLEPEVFLKNNDSYHFHDQVGTHIKTGHTGINLMDLQVVLID